MSSRLLSARSIEVLRILAGVKATSESLGDDFEIDLVSEGRSVWMGMQRLRWSTVEGLHRCCAISDTNEGGGPVRRWQINSTGRAIARRPALADEVMVAIHSGQAFTIKDDRVVPLPAVID